MLFGFKNTVISFQWLLTLMKHCQDCWLACIWFLTYAMILPISPVLLCLSLFENRSSNILIVSDFVPSSEQNTVSDHFYIPFFTLLNFHWHQQEFSTCNDCMVFPWTPFLPQSFLMKHRRHVNLIFF